MSTSFTQTVILGCLKSVACAVLLVGAAYSQNSQAPASTPAMPTQSSASKTQTPAAKKPATAAKSATPLTLTTEKDKFSYALGMSMATTLHHDAVDVDPAIVARGMKDVLAGRKTLMTEQEMRSSIVSAQNQARAKALAKARKESDDFLAANQSKEGVITLPSGLQYKVETMGSGPKPGATDTVVCNYRGTLIDGTEFDSSYRTGKPATFPLNRVIKGWTEALQLMPVGSKWHLFVPADLAYGERGDPRAGIGPDSALIFEVELLSIQGADQKPADAKPDDQK